MERFSADAHGVAETIDSVAASAQRGMARVESLAADVAVMASQISSSDGFLRDLASTIEEIVKTVALIKETSEDLAVISINTAIEAARAGDKGRGFAVIAREVRKLADRSGELSDLIGRSVSDAGSKLGSVRGAVGSAGLSSASASEASRAFADEFSSIVDSTSRAKTVVAGFNALAAERVAAEKEIEIQVRGISSESRAITGRGDSVSSLSASLRVSTERTLASISSARTASHDRALEEAESLARSLSSIDLRSRAELDAVLAAAFSRSGAAELLYVMDASGRQISSNAVNPACSGSISTAGYGADRSSKDYFKEPSLTKGAYHSPAYLSSASGSLCITASVPLFDESGIFRGVLAADFDASGLSGAVCADR